MSWCKVHFLPHICNREHYGGVCIRHVRRLLKACTLAHLAIPLLLDTPCQGTSPRPQKAEKQGGLTERVN